MNYCYHIPQDNYSAVKRIIVIGDIHGDIKALLHSLQLANVINQSHQWIGGDTHVVQVGDLLDRGGRGINISDEKSERKILKLLFKLQKQARKTGGAVHLLLGNHELMNVMGDFRYVTPLGLTDFDGDRKNVFRPGGKFAKKMACNMNSVLRIGGWIFSHAGILPQHTKYNFTEINRKVREFLLGNSEEPESTLMSLFWHRDYSTYSDCNSLNLALNNLDAQHMVVGHSVQNKINGQCNGKLWKVDVGMSSAFGTARPVQILEILNDGAQVNFLP